MHTAATPLTSDDPTPDPSSAVVTTEGPNPFGVDPALVTSPADLPPELQNDPFIAYLLRMTPEEEAHLAARAEAAAKGRELYGDERSDAWLAALVDGTHPLCRVPEPTRR